MGPDCPLELTRDHPVVRRNGGVHAHPGLGLEGSELSWWSRAWWTQEAYSARRCLTHTEDVTHGGTGPSGIPAPFLPTGVCGNSGS